MLQPPSVHNKINYWNIDYRLHTGKSDSAVAPVGNSLILFFLDYQGGLRTARTHAERLIPDESEAEEGIWIVNHTPTLLFGKILPQRKLPKTITLRNISREISLIKYIFDAASFEEDLTNRV